jgi:hypothetical protein
MDPSVAKESDTPFPLLEMHLANLGWIPAFFKRLCALSTFADHFPSNRTKLQIETEGMAGT